MNVIRTKKRSRIREKNEEAILKASEIIFAQRGYGAATTAEIARAADIPKANLHYYFNTKEELYTRVLENILKTWLTAAEDFNENHDPAQALEKYIRTKMELSRTRPHASKIFAKEIISNAPFLKDHLKDEINPWIETKKAIFDSWMTKDKVNQVDVHHLFFLIWSMTQTYADFSTQIKVVLNKEELDKNDFQTASDMIVDMVFAICGLKK